jgi:hypothetical protein
LLVQGCTAIVAAGEEQCDTDGDCVSRGFENATCAFKVCVDNAVTDPVWGCLGNIEEPIPDPNGTVEFEVQLAYAVGGAPASTAVTVDVCDKLDVTCADTDPRYPKGLHPGENGVVQLAVPEGFDGFVQLTGGGLVDSRVYVGRPLLGPPSVEQVQVLTPTDLELIAGLANETPDPTRGSAIVLVVDCKGDGGGGVRFETPNADDETLPFYLINQAPTASATATDTDGFGGFFNLPVSSAVVRAFREVDDVFVGESSFQVLAGVLSYVLVSPTPVD